MFPDMKSYKKSIKARDGFMCQNPRCRNKNNKRPIPLTVYPLSEETIPSPWQFITLCRDCETRIKKGERTLKAALVKKMNEKYKNNWKGESNV